jgi:hypothetical protein
MDPDVIERFLLDAQGADRLGQRRPGVTIPADHRLLDDHPTSSHPTRPTPHDKLVFIAAAV